MVSRKKTLKTNEKIKPGLFPSFVGGDVLADFHGIVDMCQNVKNLLLSMMRKSHHVHPFRKFLIDCFDVFDKCQQFSGNRRKKSAQRVR